MTLQELLGLVYQQPEALVFQQVLDVIEQEFEFTPTPFANGSLMNKADENQGSCKVFSFAHQAGLSEAQTLSLFAEHYRSVLADPDGAAHGNIRQFMQNGWQGISFPGKPLQKR